MRVIGIDPGSIKTGFGIIDFNGHTAKWIAHGIISLDSKLSVEERLFILSNDLNDIIENYKPHTAFVEQVFVCKNFKSALTLGQARGAVIGVFGIKGIKVSNLSPTEIKSIIAGKGHAKKFQIAQIVAMELAIHTPKEEDSSDALACALAGCFKERMQR